MGIFQSLGISRNQRPQGLMHTYLVRAGTMHTHSGDNDPKYLIRHMMSWDGIGQVQNVARVIGERHSNMNGSVWYYALGARQRSTATIISGDLRIPSYPLEDEVVGTSADKPEFSTSMLVDLSMNHPDSIMYEAFKPWLFPKDPAVPQVVIACVPLPTIERLFPGRKISDGSAHHLTVAPGGRSKPINIVLDPEPIQG